MGVIFFFLIEVSLKKNGHHLEFKKYVHLFNSNFTALVINQRKGERYYNKFGIQYL